MLTGYQKKEAVALILSRLYPEDYTTLPQAKLKSLIGQCVDADFHYMISNKVSRRDGTDGTCFYNKLNARDSIVMTLSKKNHFTEEQFDDILRLVDDYMDFNRSYLEKNGLSYHEDERLFEYRAYW